MAGLSPKLPVALDDDDGFKLNKTYRDMVVQNFKNILLTSPGERVMDPEFGVGIRKYLFEPNESEAYFDLEGKIHEQVIKYLPFISIEQINFSAPTEISPDTSTPASMLDGHYMGIQILFKIIPLGQTEILKLP